MLTENDGPPFEVVNGGGVADCLVVCDHASDVIPERLGDLGLDERHLREHIAWDIGAAAMTRRLAERLDAPAVLAGFSRLVVDCNRYLDDPAAFVEVSDRVTVPGNAALSAAAKQERADAFYRPYHGEIDRRIEAAMGAGKVLTVVSVHTMTDRMRGKELRPQEVTVCWDRDERLALSFIRNLEAVDGLVVGDNDPYGLDLGEDYTVPEHAMRRGLPHIQLEVRQDLVGDAEAALRYADLLYDAMAEPLASKAARGLEHHWPLEGDVQPRR
ncbi:MAG: N-formylglutamate amidohydrolase [Pseudomonadota bacterium]